MKTTLRLILTSISMLCFIFFATAQNESEIKIGQVSPGEIDYAGFKLNKDATLKIKGHGASVEKWGNNLTFYGWIIESESREVVWNLLDEYENKYFHGEGVFSFDTELKLKKGSYEAYFTGIYGNNITFNYYGNDFGDMVHAVIKELISDDRDDKYSYSEKENYYMAITAEGTNLIKNDGNEYIDKMVSKSVASFVRTGNDDDKSKNFSLKNDTKMYIYCQGEREGNEFYDYGWIYNLKTHKKVWPNNETDYERAGGARKNYAVYQELILPAGDYQVNYSTDGSHSYYKWNALPPHDPQFWGISIWCDKANMKNISSVVNENIPVIDMRRMHNNEFETQGFELTKDLDLRVICLGEIADYEPDDYGWIIDASSGKMVWKFSRDNSEYAGGGDKNRISNEILKLKKGKYIAYFASDGSHSYKDWNVAPPSDKKMWGLSIWAENSADKSLVKLFEEENIKDENLIAGITKVRDNQRKYVDFTLNKEQKVRVYAIGEGDDGDMFDTGWVKNMDTGKVVWEMTYRTSEHAGGAHKNRMFNDFILLPKGNYRLYYESDGSHSFMDWNDNPPYDQMNYGIRILKN